MLSAAQLEIVTLCFHITLFQHFPAEILSYCAFLHENFYHGSSIMVSDLNWICAANPLCFPPLELLLSHMKIIFRVYWKTLLCMMKTFLYAGWKLNHGCWSQLNKNRRHKPHIQKPFELFPQLLLTFNVGKSHIIQCSPVVVIPLHRNRTVAARYTIHQCKTITTLLMPHSLRRRTTLDNRAQTFTGNVTCICCCRLNHRLCACVQCTQVPSRSMYACDTGGIWNSWANIQHTVTNRRHCRLRTAAPKYDVKAYDDVIVTLLLDEAFR